MDNGGVDEAAWEQRASGLEEGPQIGAWRCRDTWETTSTSVPPPFSPDSGQHFCSHSVTQGPRPHVSVGDRKRRGTHRGASEASRTRGTRLTTVSLQEEEDIGEVFSMLGKEGDEGIKGWVWVGVESR